VEARRQSGILSVSQVLNLDSPRPAVPAPTAQIVGVALLGHAHAQEKTAMQQSFESAALATIEKYPRETAQKYPEILHWYVTTPRPQSAAPSAANTASR
jgi:hypothetical protein